MPKHRKSSKSTDLAGNGIASVVEPGDITANLGHKAAAASAADQFYALQTAILKKKIAAGADGTGGLNLGYLAVESPIDKLTESIARKLSNVQEGSPEWAQLLDIVGNPKADRLTIAKFLAEIQYKKASTEQMLERYGITAAEGKDAFVNVWNNSKNAVRGDAVGVGGVGGGAAAAGRPAAQQSVAANAGLAAPPG
jgi:hypothetical protein